jgi:hypothetical protein
MDADRIDYQRLLQNALRGVVRSALEHVAEHGMPGDHHFYIGFSTDYPGVMLPPFLHDQYPEEMTIVLQHQFWELEIGPESFSVLLNFNARRLSLTVPFAAVTTFADPTAEFALRFEPGTEDGEAPPEPEEAAPAPRAVPDKPGDVIRFDPSRRR